MATLQKNISVGDDLGGKTLYFDFSVFNSFSQNLIFNQDLIYVNDNNKIIMERYQSGSTINGNLYLVSNGNRVLIATFRPMNTKFVDYNSISLPSNFGTVSRITINNQFQRDIYNGITYQAIADIYMNGVKLSNIYFDGTQVNKVYLNGEQVF